MNWQAPAQSIVICIIYKICIVRSVISCRLDIYNALIVMIITLREKDSYGLDCIY